MNPLSTTLFIMCDVIMDRWALAFTLLPWPERRKAALWSCLEKGESPDLCLEERRAFEALDPDQSRMEAQCRGAKLWLPSDPGVMRLMRDLPYPVALWVRGSLPPEGIRLAMVGSRQASAEGLRRTRLWASRLTHAGVSVISGLARGIDGAAHEGALETGGTWGIMGSGLDHPYPPEHKNLMDRMALRGGVITPFPPQSKPMKWHFPRRNWLLAAWSHGIVLMEAKVNSGSMVSARLALDLGRELWACPGAPEKILSEGPNSLLREGAARLCRSPEDIIEDLGSLPLA